VLTQSVFTSGKCTLEYLIRDGASTDATLDILRPYQDRGLLSVVSEPDSGFYPALAKGLRAATGDYVAYLNAGDLLHPGGLAIAAECLRIPTVDWVTGYAVIYNDQSHITNVWLPFRYRRELIECGTYGTFLPFIQQESTAWRRGLLQTVDFDYLAKLRLAGDAYLWRSFAKVSELTVVRGCIGGFRVHRGQMSERMAEYRAEMRTFCRRPTTGERLHALVERLLWGRSESVKCRLGASSPLVVYDHKEEAWRLMPRGVGHYY
jgi:glycosyltransferase involved in cell wall biosynthesis